MARSTELANETITEIKRRNVQTVYGNASKRQRGIAVKETFSLYPFLIGSLDDNTNYDLLTPLQRDKIIDKLLV